jgi:hypothetical protein
MDVLTIGRPSGRRPPTITPFVYGHLLSSTGAGAAEIILHIMGRAAAHTSSTRAAARRTEAL